MIGASEMPSPSWPAAIQSPRTCGHGPITGRLLAQQIAGQTPVIDHTPYLPERFAR